MCSSTFVLNFFWAPLNSKRRLSGGKSRVASAVEIHHTNIILKHNVNFEKMVWVQLSSRHPRMPAKSFSGSTSLFLVPAFAWTFAKTLELLTDTSHPITWPMCKYPTSSSTLGIHKIWNIEDLIIMVLGIQAALVLQIRHLMTTARHGSHPGCETSATVWHKATARRTWIN